MKRSRTSGRARFATAAAVAIAVGVLASLGGVGYAAGVVHFDHSSPAATQYPPPKVTICHHTHSQQNPFVTITVSEHALPAHLGHGDTVGACSSQQQTTTETQVETSAPKPERPSHQNRGHQGSTSHGQGSGKPSWAGGGKGQGNHGKANGHGQSGVHGSGHGRGQNHGQGHGQGQGHGGGNHGNSGGGHGNGGHGNGGGHGHEK